MHDFLVGDPPPVILIFRHLLVKDLFSRYKENTRSKISISGTFSTSWKLGSTVRNRLFGRRLFFVIYLNNTVAIRSRRISTNGVQSINQSINKSIIYFDTLRRGARKLAQNTKLYK